MEELLRSYGLWIVLGLVFLAMYRFGGGCGAGHRHGPPSTGDETAGPGEKKKPQAHAGHSGGCH